MLFLQLEMKTKTVERKYLVPFVLVTSLFLLWGIANNMTDTLLCAFKRITSMSDAQTSLIQFAFYGAYFCVAFPASLFIRRHSYKSGVILGLALYAAGAILFLPAARAASYAFYLIAIYILAAGCSILETTANPYILNMGSPKTATRRLNIAQSFNPIGSISGILLSKFFILKDISYHSVSGTYMTLGCVLLGIMVVMMFVDMPAGRAASTGTSLKDTIGRLLGNRKYKFGVLAQFFYVGAQIGVWSFTIRLVMEELGITESSGATIYLATIIGFCVSRFIYTWLMKFVRPSVLLAAGAVLSAASAFGIVFSAGSGYLVVALLIMISFFMSLMFPTIYGIALGDVDALAKGGRAGDSVVGASGLIMAILGGAVLTPLQGILSDATNIYTSFLIPAFCFVVVLAFAIYVIHSENTAMTGAAFVDMAGYVRGASGSDSVIYHAVSDSGVLIKLYKPGYPVEAVKAEIDTASKVWDMGLPCPEPGDLVTDGQRLGIRYGRIAGKRSYSQMFAEEPGRTEELARELAAACRKLHSTVCPEGMFQDISQRYLTMLDEADLPESEKAGLRKFIESVPAAGTVLHGDLHTGNVVSTLPKGTALDAQHEVKFIDLDRFCCGNPLWDLGMMRYACIDAPEVYRIEKLHIHGAQAAEIWEYFAQEYFKESGMTFDKIEELVKPFCKVIGIEKK